jgi:hypothetical protein
MDMESDLRRRALIGAAVLAPLLASTPAAAISPDAELLDLVRRWREARAADDRHYAGPHAAAEERYQALVGPPSDVLRARPVDWGVGLLSPQYSHFQAEDLGHVLRHRRQIKRCFAKYPTEPNARELVRSTAIAAELVSLRQRERNAMAVSGFGAAQAESRRLTAATLALEGAIRQAPPARTHAGVAAKSALALSVWADGDPFAEAVIREIGEIA